MGLFSNIFKKKPGGTMVGNLLRGVSSNFTGGMLGSGANRIELGQTKTNAQLAAEAGLPANNAALNMAASAVMSNEQVQAAAKAAAWAKYKPFVIGGGIIAALGTTIYLATRKKGFRR